MAEQEGETITMSDVLARELALEEEAEAKLQENWGDENACTHDQGYITQPIFSCGTCVAKGKEPFGFCFGCSMNCHVDHDVYELFDKRHFKCDCGTPKSNSSCKFSEAPRLQNNEENKYTHNFQGKYCWCASAYDPDSDIMSQCVVCEDWFHHTCVARRTEIPDLATFKGFLCHLCTAKHPFFLQYPQLQPPSTSPFLSASNNNSSTTATSSGVTATTKPAEKAEDTKTEASTNTKFTTENKTTNTTTTDSTTEPTITDNTNNKDKETKQEPISTENAKDSEKPTTEPVQCILEQHPAPPTPASFPDIFLIPGWRKGVCKCGSCTNMYMKEHLEWLLDDADDPDEGEGEGEEGEGEAEQQADTAAEAAGDGRKRKISMLESAEQAFLENPQIPHSNKLNLITGFSDMKTELKEYLRQFAESGRVVTEADIAEFFEEFRKKRPRI